MPATPESLLTQQSFAQINIKNKNKLTCEFCNIYFSREMFSAITIYFTISMYGSQLVMGDESDVRVRGRLREVAGLPGLINKYMQNYCQRLLLFIVLRSSFYGQEVGLPREELERKGGEVDGEKENGEGSERGRVEGWSQEYRKRWGVEQCRSGIQSGRRRQAARKRRKKGR